MRSLILVLLTILVLSACSGQTDAAPSPTIPSGEGLVTPMAAPEEDVEPPPQAAGLVILYAPPGIDPNLLAARQAELQPVAAEHSLNLEVRQELTLASVPAGLELVVLLGSAPGIAELISGLPEVIFIAEQGNGLPAAPNLTILQGSGNPTHQAFLAGYIAAVQSEEWRIGMLAANDPEGIRNRKAFLNGVIYFCGPCQPIYPPFETYPGYVELPPGASQPDLEAAAEQLISKGVNLIHVAPTFQSEAIFQFLAQRGVRLVGTAAPPAGLEGNWVASVIFSSAIPPDEAADLILSGEAVPVGDSAIEISFAGISQARLDHLEEVLKKLLSGEIDPVGLVE